MEYSYQIKLCSKEILIIAALLGYESVFGDISLFPINFILVGRKVPAGKDC